MTTSVLILGGFGTCMTVVGVLGVSGRLVRAPSSLLLGNDSACLLLGVATLLGSATLAPGNSWPGQALSVPTMALYLVGLYAFFVRPPRWSQPR